MRIGMKRICCLFLLAILLNAVVCRAENRIAFIDDLGRNVTIENAPQRVAVLIGSFADIWCLAGGSQTIVAAADDTFRNFNLPLQNGVINLGSNKDLSMEKLLLSDPDLVIASCSTAHHVELEPVFSQMGLNSVYFDVDSFEDYLRMLEICTQITGCPEN